MANVIFKRGLQRDLPQSGVDGTLYLTTDTNRIYMSVGKTLKQMNNGFMVIENLAKLEEIPKTKELIGSFYYVVQDNVLCYYGESQKWVQINPDAHISKDEQNITLTDVENNHIQLNSIVSDNENNFSKGQVDIVGTGIISVTQDNDHTITISGTAQTDTSYILDAKEGTASDNKAEISLIGSTGDPSTVTIEGGPFSSIKSNTPNTIAIDGVSQQITSINALNQPQGFKLDVIQEGNSEKSTAVDPLIQLHDGASVHFIEGTATLNAYSTSEIDTKVSDLQTKIKNAASTMNAMKYCGAIGEGNTYTTIAALLQSNSLHNGDTYKVSSSNVGEGAKIGDLVIVQGDEDGQGIITTGKKFVSIIPSGDEIDTKYSVNLSTTTNPNFTFTSDQDSSTGQKVEFSAKDDSIVVNGVSGDKNLNIQISHKKYSEVQPSDQGAVFGGQSVTVITNLTTENGHITGLKTKSMTLPKEITWEAF